MQCEIDINTYKRVKKNKFMTSIKERPFKLIGLLLIGTFISRVILHLDKGTVENIAPFGLAFLLSIIERRELKNTIAISLGTIIGYVTITRSISDKYVNLIAITLLLIYVLIFEKIEKNIKTIYMYELIAVSYFLYGLLVNQYDLWVNITITAINMLIIIPVKYVISYGIKCVEEFNVNYYFSSEEIISAGILICLAIAGIGELNIFEVSIREIIAYTCILFVAYSGGVNYGSAVGISMGIIVGVTTGSVLDTVAFYGVVGFICGIFKDIGKVFVVLAYVLSMVVLGLYTQNIDIPVLVEIAASSVLFLLIPKACSNALENEFNTDKKIDKINEVQLDEIKEQFAERVKDLEESLGQVSKTLNSFTDNQKLTLKNKSTALVENLADRVCSTKCGKCDKCWGRDFNITYQSFEKLIRSYEDKKIIFPKNLERMCLYKFDLISETEKIIGSLGDRELVKERMSDGRKILAENISNVSSRIGEMLKDFNKKVQLCQELDKMVRRGLNKYGIEYKNVFCYRDTNGRVKIKLTLQNCGGGKYCSKTILPIINSIINTHMSIGGEGCKIDPKTNDCNMIFEESPKYQIVSYGAVAVKNGENYTGDTYSFGKAKDGNYMTLISDGMGSGPEASKESQATIDLMEKFIDAGFSKSAAINTINSIMAMKFEEDEKFSTLDFNMIDLYSGEITFIKVGAVASFIKRGKKVKPIISNMPPLGLVDSVDVEEVKSNVTTGDIIVTISDGILDVNEESLGRYNWIESYLEDCSKDPKKLAEDILDRAKGLSGGRAKDDMTVVVSKVYPLC